jgi:hypothetical protein
MSQVAGANRRIHSRRSARLPARLSHEAESVDGVVENIGEGGAFFATENLELNAEEGSPVTLSFRCLREGAEQFVERPGSVLRTERYFDGEKVVRAYAVRFDETMSMDGVVPADAETV